MKKFVLMVLVAVFASSWVAKANTEEERYWEYVVASLEYLQQAGAVFAGQVYESSPWDDQNQDPASFPFAEYFAGGTARAVINCSPGWYQAWASWEDAVNRDQLFYSQYIEKTYFGAGQQTLQILMAVNPYRTIRFEIQGVPTSDDEVWFNGVRAWRDGNVWRVTVRKPWDVIGSEVEVVWTGHGGWRIPLLQSYFGGVVVFNTSDMDKTILSATQLKAVSFLGEGTYLQDQPLEYTGRYYSQEFGCEVLEIDSALADDIQEFTLVLNGYDEYSGQRVNYYSATLRNVGGLFMIPLGDESIRPMTVVRIFFIDPRTGEYAWQYLNAQDLWYGNSGGKG